MHMYDSDINRMPKAVVTNHICPSDLLEKQIPEFTWDLLNQKLQWCSDSKVLRVCQAWIQRPTGMRFTTWGKHPIVQGNQQEMLAGRRTLAHIRFSINICIKNELMKACLGCWKKGMIKSIILCFSLFLSSAQLLLSQGWQVIAVRYLSPKAEMLVINTEQQRVGFLLWIVVWHCALEETENVSWLWQVRNCLHSSTVRSPGRAPSIHCARGTKCQHLLQQLMRAQVALEQ